MFKVMLLLLLTTGCNGKYFLARDQNYVQSIILIDSYEFKDSLSFENDTTLNYYLAGTGDNYECRFNIKGNTFSVMS